MNRTAEAFAVVLALTVTLAAYADDMPVMALQTGHTCSLIREACFSPDGRWVATCGCDAAIIIWDAATGEQLRVLRGHTDEVETISFSPDGRYLASGDSDSVYILWDLKTWQPAKTWRPEDEGWAGAVRFSPDGKTLSAGGRGGLHLWGVDSDAFDRQISAAPGNVGFTPDGQFVLGISRNALVYWDVRTGNEADRIEGRDIEGGDRPLSGMVVSPDGKLLVATNADHMMTLWDIARRTVVSYLAATPGELNSALYFSPDGKLLAAATKDKRIVLWDVTTGQKKPGWSTGEQAADAICFSPDGRVLAGVLGDCTVALWDVATGAQQRKLSYHISTFHAVVFRGDGKAVAAGPFWESAPIEWDLIAAKPIPAEKREKIPSIWCLACSPDGKLIATDSDENKDAVLWDAATMRVMAQLSGHKEKLTSLCFSPDSQTLATGSGNEVKLWDVKTRTVRRTITWPISEEEGAPGPPRGDGPGSLFFSPDGKLLAVDGVLYDVGSGTKIRQFDIHAEGIRPSLAFSPNGKFLASGGDGLFEIDSGKLAPFLGPHRDVESVCFSPDGNTLASASMADGVRLWDVATGEPERTLASMQDAAEYVAFSPDGKTLAVGCMDGAIELWDVARGERLANLYSFDEQKAWLITLPDGRYAGSDNIGTYFRWRVGDKLCPAEKYAAEFCRPDAIRAALAGRF